MSTERGFTPPSEGDFQLLSDTSRTNKLPPSLECLLRRLYENQIKTSAEVLIAAIWYSFLECGLVPTSISAELSGEVRTHSGFSFVAGIPKNSWQTVADQIIHKFMESRAQKQDATTSTAPQTDAQKDIYTFKLALLNHSDEELQLIIRKIFGGSTLCVMFCSEHHEHSASVVVPVNGFVDSTKVGDFELIRHDPQRLFLNTQALSAQIKEQLIEPIRNVIMYDGAYAHAALNGLPKEILWSLLQYFRKDLQTLQKMSHTCVYLRNMTLSFLHESKIQLKQRRPTPITYDVSNHIQPRSRRRFYNVYPWLFHPFNY